MKLIIDHERCQGHALCRLKAPRIFELNDEGYNRMPPLVVPPAEEEDARRGAMNCPEGAIRISAR
jgi:ferredoxin